MVIVKVRMDGPVTVGKGALAVGIVQQIPAYIIHCFF